MTKKSVLFLSAIFILNVCTIFTACQKKACLYEPIEPIEVTDLASEIQFIENNLIQKQGDEKRYNILNMMDCHNVPGLSIALVQEGAIKWAKGYGIANSKSGTIVDEHTLFQAASISKPLSALAALKLVEEGKIDLDADVNQYLKDWKVPENNFTQQEKVTLRRLLTHTAGTTVHGFGGYKTSKTMPTIEMVLNGEGNSGKVTVDKVPGSEWKYSGGGFTIMEKLVEDVSGLPLEGYFEEVVLNPLEMDNSTFEQPLPAHLHGQASAAYNKRGKLIKGLWHNYPEQAAAGLWTTPTDLAKYCIEIQELANGKTNGILQPTTVQEMLTKHDNDWGLGPALEGSAEELIFSHGGKNAGFTNTLIAFANKGNAVVIMSNGDNGGEVIDQILRGISDYYGWNLGVE